MDDNKDSNSQTQYETTTTTKTMDSTNIRWYSQTEQYLLTINPEVKTCLDCIYHGFEIAKEQDCIGRKSGYSSDYEWFSYNQTIFKMHSFGSGLVHIGGEPNNHTMIVLYGRNNFKSLIAEFGCYHYSMVPVPIYDSFKGSIVLEILNQIEPGVIVTDSNERAKKLIRICRSFLHTIIITSENIHPETLTYGKKMNIKLYPFTEIERLGSLHPSPVNVCKIHGFIHELIMVSYTSGATGQPKGVLLTHGNLVANCSAILYQINGNIDLKFETMVSYSSIAHLRERIIKLCMFYSGGRVGIYFGDFKDLSRDLPILEPTIMVCVPRILNRIYHRVIGKLKGNWMKSRVLNVALKTKNSDTIFNDNIKNSIWDKLVFKTVQQMLGGNLKLLISGSNQISDMVLNFMRNSLRCTVLQSYEITECSSFVTLTKYNDQSQRHLGNPIACCAIKLIDVPEMNIWTKNAHMGEICVKGTNVFSGYYKDYESYMQNVDEDGWFHTGDVGQFTMNGLKFMDRRRDLQVIQYNNIIRWVAPNKIENIYIQSIYVGQCYVDIDIERGCLIAVIVPDIDGINLWCSENNMLLSSAEACKNVAFRNTLINDIKNIGNRERLKEYEQVHDVVLHSDPFTHDSGLLTPTMKLKRYELYHYFRDEIDAVIEALYNGSHSQH
ncbi:hypothetical protein DERF_002372 [Dermatophagoides farinae]|uniref:long-chain-fatty-acid--CoA ligase n=1 Tax=Dermatophagoides farinae TaxID=6954 RepID=A0A922IGA5_DERFA|nr:hypothetical protein DERF_002372 [Dermatophagoides farinae]